MRCQCRIDELSKYCQIYVLANSQSFLKNFFFLNSMGEAEEFHQLHHLDSQGEEEQDSGPSVLDERRRRLRLLTNAALFSERTNRRRRMQDRRRLARMEFRQNLRILRRHNQEELARRMQFFHQLVYLGHRNADLRHRLLNILQRASYITQLNDRLFQVNRYLRDQLRQINRHTHRVLSRPH